MAFNSLLRGSTPISARLRGSGSNSNRSFHTRLRTESEHSSDVSDSEQYYDEESGCGSTSQDGLDDSTDSTMELCPQTNQSQNQNQNQNQKSNLRLSSQLNGNSKYIVLNGTNTTKDEDGSDDDIDSTAKLSQKNLITQNKSLSRGGFGQKFHHHKIETKNKIKKNSTREVDYEIPVNLQTKTLISPVEQDILERRALSMATHGKIILFNFILIFFYVML